MGETTKLGLAIILDHYASGIKHHADMHRHSYILFGADVYLG